MIPGSDPELAAERVAIEAYYDGISVVPGRAPSAETACGIAALLELARHLAAHPPARTTILVATSAHFQGRQGVANFLARHARRLEEPLHIDLFIGLDLSSRTDQVGIWNNTARPELRRFFAPFGRRFSGYASTLDSAVVGSLVNGITPIKGLDWSAYMPGGIAANSQFALEGGLISLGLITVNDARLQIDSPLDQPAAVNYGNLARQVALINGVLQQALNDPQLLEEKESFGPVLQDRLRDLRLKVRTFPRRSQTPDRPVPDAVVVVRRQWATAGKAVKGVRTAQVHLSDDEGELLITGLPQAQYRTNVYVLDPQDGAITYAADLSKRAEGFHGAPLPDGSIPSSVQWALTEKSVVVFPCLSRPFYGLINPRSLNFLSGITVINRYDTVPRQYGYALGSGLDEAAGVVFGPQDADPQNRIKILAGRQLLLLNNGIPDSRPNGEGFAWLKSGWCRRCCRPLGICGVSMKIGCRPCAITPLKTSTCSACTSAPPKSLKPPKRPPSAKRVESLRGPSAGGAGIGKPGLSRGHSDLKRRHKGHGVLFGAAHSRGLFGRAPAVRGGADHAAVDGFWRVIGHSLARGLAGASRLCHCPPAGHPAGLCHHGHGRSRPRPH